jgi:hypothetical protein
VHLERVTVTDLPQELEACEPDAEVRIAQQPTWPFEDAIDPSTAAVQVDLDPHQRGRARPGRPATSLNPSASNSAGSQPEQQGAHHGVHPR